MLNIGRWVVVLVCAAPGALGVTALAKDGRAMTWQVDLLIGGVTLIHLAAAYGLLRWRNWGRWLAIPALAVFFLGTWSSFFEDEEYFDGSLLLAGGLAITIWLILPAVRQRFAQEKAAA
jgi:uncharacterized membrane protein (DUF2068 family)